MNPEHCGMEIMAIETPHGMVVGKVTSFLLGDLRRKT